MFKNIKMSKAKRILKKRIISRLKKGKSKEDIIKEAQKVGWKKETLEEIFEQIENKKKKEIEIKIPIKKKPEKKEKKEKKSFAKKWKERKLEKLGIQEKEKKEEEKEETLEEELERKEPEEETKIPKKGLVSQINEIKESLDIISQKKKQEKKLKKKKFKIPFKVKSRLKKLAVKNKVQVMLLQRTRNIKPVIGEIRDGMLLIKDMIYNGGVDSTWLWNGKYPTHIVPEWDLQPMTPEGIEEMKATSTLSPSELSAYCTKFGRLSVPGKIIIRAIEAKQNLMLKGKANVKAIILAIVGTLVVAAILFGEGIV